MTVYITDDDDWGDKNNNRYGLSCNGGWVQHMRLDKNGLGGNVPASLGQLTSLRSLDLSRNGLMGPIPWQFGTFLSLFACIL
jgi:Leucine-rich repeat (LRR) protein